MWKPQQRTPGTMSSKRDKEYIVLVANRLAIAGLESMALSMCGAILLIRDLVFDTPVPAVSGAGSALVFAWLWFVRPMRRRHRLEDEPDPRTATSA